MRITGLPFTVSPYLYQAVSIFQSTLAVGAGMTLCARMAFADTAIEPLICNPAGAFAFVPMDTAVASLVISGSYLTD